MKPTQKVGDAKALRQQNIPVEKGGNLPAGFCACQGKIHDGREKNEDKQKDKETKRRSGEQ